MSLCPACKEHPKRILKSGRVLSYCRLCDLEYQSNNYRKHRETRPKKIREQKSKPYDSIAYANSDKTKHKARVAVRNAIRDGRLEKAEYCTKCGSSERLEAHHLDYSKPLEVQWYCSTCHGKEHWSAESQSKN
jgi:ribosomal protein S27AE